MRVLVLGGTGFIGAYLVKRLKKKEVDVTVIADHIDSVIDDVRYFKCDRNDKDALLECFKNNTFDVIYDLCCFSVEQMRNIILTLKDKVRHYILCSTASVYDFDRFETMPVKEDDMIKTGMKDEYGYQKAECERILTSSEAGFYYTIVRPCYIYGEGCADNRLEYLVDRIIDQMPLILFNNLEITFQLLHVEDLINALIALPLHESAYGEIFNISPDESVSLKKLIEMLGRIEQKKVKIIGKDNFSDLRKMDVSRFYLNKVYDFSVIFSNQKLKEKLRWESATRLSDGLKRICHYRREYLKYHPNSYECEKLLNE